MATFVADEEVRTEPDVTSATMIKDTSLLAEHSTGFNRTVVLYTTLASAGETELLELLNNARAIAQSSVRQETIFAIAGRFTAIDPRRAMEVVNELPIAERDPFLAAIITEWSVTDLDSAVEAITHLERDLRLTALESIVKVRDDLPAAALRAIARKLGHPEYFAYLASHSKSTELADNPIAAWSVIVQDGLDDKSQFESLILVAEAAIEQQGLDALFRLREPFADEIDYNEKYFPRIKIFRQVVDALVKNDPRKTWAYIESGSSQLLNETVGQTNLRNQDVTSQRDRAFMTDTVQQLLLKSWAIMDPVMVIDRIEQIPFHLQPLACERALAELARTEPERAIEIIPTLKHLGAAKTGTLDRIIENWAADDPSKALDWILSSIHVEQDSREELIKSALYELVLKDPKQAMRAAAAEPNSARLEAFVLTELARFNLDTAFELLSKVSEPARYISTIWLAREAIKQGDTDRALELVLQFEESSNEEVNWFMFFLDWSSENPVQLFERLDDFPPELRYEGAHALDYNSEPELTQEQLDYVRTIYKRRTYE